MPLPTPEQVRDDFTTMVEFGPRLTASGPHSDYIDWLEQEFIDAGLQMLPRDNFTTDRWAAQQVGLDILSGPSAGPVKVATYFPRSQETPPAGLPDRSSTAGPRRRPASASRAPRTWRRRWRGIRASWPRGPDGLQSLLGGGPEGSILAGRPTAPCADNGRRADAGLDVPVLAGPLARRLDDVRLQADLAPAGLQMPLAQFQQTGATGVVFILDCSYEALKGGYLPFDESFQPLPALYVDRDTGRALRAQAAGRPNTRLTLTATRQQTPTQAITAVLPGESSEVIIFNTHTDGQGFVEENGGVAFVQLARYFASRPRRERLRRTLVFAAWPGHMVADITRPGGCRRTRTSSRGPQRR